MTPSLGILVNNLHALKKCYKKCLFQIAFPSGISYGHTYRLLLVLMKIKKLARKERGMFQEKDTISYTSIAANTGKFKFYSIYDYDVIPAAE